MDKISSIDFFSDEFRFTNWNGDTRNKCVIGGFITILFFITSISGIAYFINDFVRRGTFNVITSSTLSNDYVIANYTKIPFMLRITQSAISPFSNPESIISAIIYKYSTLTDDEVENSIQQRVIYNGQTCDINNPFHFHPDYRDLFTQFEDLHTFICGNYEGDLQDLIGTYGSISKNQYFTYNISPCVNNTKPGIVCETSENIRTILNDSRIEIRTLNYKTNSYSAIPNEMLVENNKFDASYSLNRRIWVYYKTVNYKTDLGFILEDIRDVKFFMIDHFNIDVNLADLSKTAATGAFLRVTKTNLKEDITYARFYIKAQTMIANLGGLIKGISVIASILSYYFNRDQFVVDLINQNPKFRFDVVQLASFKLNEQDVAKLFVSERNFIEPKKMKRSTKTSHLKLNHSNILGIDQENIFSGRITGEDRIPRSLMGDSCIFQYTLKDYVLPFLRCSKSGKIKSDFIRLANKCSSTRLSIFNLINQLDQYSKFMSLSLADSERNLLEYLYNPKLSKIKDEKDFELQVQELKTNPGNQQMSILKLVENKA